MISLVSWDIPFHINVAYALWLYPIYEYFGKWTIATKWVSRLSILVYVVNHVLEPYEIFDVQSFLTFYKSSTFMWLTNRRSSVCFFISLEWLLAMVTSQDWQSLNFKGFIRQKASVFYSKLCILFCLVLL